MAKKFFDTTDLGKFYKLQTKKKCLFLGYRVYVDHNDIEKDIQATLKAGEEEKVVF